MHTRFTTAEVQAGSVWQTGRTGWVGDGLHDCDGVVVEDCRHIFGRKLVGGITDEQTCLSHRTVADNNASTEATMISKCESKKSCTKSCCKIRIV